MQLKHIKPYLFILSFFIIPIVLIPIIKHANSKLDNFEIIGENLASKPDITYAIAIHGGAGNFTQDQLTKEQIAAYKSKLYEALQMGVAKLENSDSATSVVVEVIKVLEDSPLFNAGKGSVFSNNGINEMDASIMDGATKNAGAIAGVTTTKNPIQAACSVMKHSNYVLLSGIGAEQYAQNHNIEMVDRNYFYTKERWNDLQKCINNEKPENNGYGAVGCVVLDQFGNLAAGTSTGGITNKKYGRVGDSPIIGACTYADENCAISATGQGEFLIRYTIAYDIAARIKYLHENVDISAQTVITNLESAGGHAGVIAIDKKGNISMPYNTKSMFRAFYKLGSEPQILLY